MNTSRNQKGFTLIELLIVIAIVAILAAVVILTLNPAQLLAQARDSNRISDMSTLKSAISLYQTDVTSPNIAFLRGYAACYYSLSTEATGATSSAGCGGLFSTTAYTATTTANANLRKVDGTGWIPVKFIDISAGSPIGNLPVDPTNTSSSLLYYAYAASSTNLTFEIDARMESIKYSTGGGDVVTTDGGNSPTWYEVGTAPGLAL